MGFNSGFKALRGNMLRDFYYYYHYHHHHQNYCSMSIIICFRIHTDFPIKQLSRSSDSPRVSTHVTPLRAGIVDRFLFWLKPSKFNGQFRWLPLYSYVCIFSLHIIHWVLRDIIHYPTQRENILISFGLHWKKFFFFFPPFSLWID